jgi:ATP-binding cassette subfamily C protein
MPVFDALINSLLLIVIVGMLLTANTTATIALLLSLGGVYGILNIYTRVKLKKKGAERLDADTRRFRTVTEALSGIKITRVMGIESFFIDQYSIHSREFAKAIVFAKSIEKLPFYLMESIVFGGLVLFIVIALSRGGDVGVIIPLVSLYAFAGKRLMPALQTIYSSITQIYYSQAILDKIYNDMIVEEESERTSPETPLQEDIPFHRSIFLRDIQFRYAANTRDIIDHLNLEIPKGSVVGFAGSTGSGKTTLVDIILGLLSPGHGRVMIDDTLLTPENASAWRRKLGYVPQDIYLSDDTIRNNIAFGVAEDRIDEERVRQAAEIAALDAFILTLPERYDTVIGERGVRLSGGQRQRIGLARALYRNPEVLVLDEATSSLDGTTEEAVLNAIRNASKARTVIMIAHRLNTLKDCDTIYIMEEGRFSARGTYEDLLHGNKTFMSMAKIEHS